MKHMWRYVKFESFDNTNSRDWDSSQRIEIVSPSDKFDGVVQLQAVSGDSIDPDRYVVSVTLNRESLRDFIDELERYTK